MCGGLACLCAGAAVVFAAAAGSQPTWRRAVVVLVENERVLAGEIRDQGDSLVMRRSAGTLRIAKSRVFRVCDSFEALYELKQREIEKRDPDEHVQLAQWCLRYGLREHARKELAFALKLDPEHRQAQIMHDSIVHLSGPRKPRPTSPRRGAKTPQTQPRQADASVTYGGWVALQQPDTLAKFAGRVQVVLLNHCGSAACHGGGHKGVLRLYRPASGVPRSRGTTRKNLRAVYRCIRVDKPDASPILVKPLSPRGGEPPTHAGGRIFVSTDDSGFLILRNWVLSVRSSPKPSPPRTRRRSRGTGPRTKKR